MTLTKAFAATEVKFEKSMAAVEAILGKHGIRESRYTHLRPSRLANSVSDEKPEAQGSIVYEFVGGVNETRRGVRVSVGYRPVNTGYKKPGGTSEEMAARALYWYLKAKFDSIDYGIEDFDVAFMPHLVTSIGTTFAEEPGLIASAILQPESVARLALPAPR
jgi:hypothetical protein